MPKTRTSYIVLNKIDYLKKDFFWKLTLFKTHVYMYRNQNEAVDEETRLYNKCDASWFCFRSEASGKLKYVTLT